jgi:hypothetical protein
VIRTLFTRFERRIFFVLPTIVLGLAAALRVPVRPVSHAYRSVTDKSLSKGLGDDHIVSKTAHDYLLSQGKLYLHVQASSGSLLAPLVQMEEWDGTRLRRFMAENPKVSFLFPDPKSPDGGVEWIPMPPGP